VARGKEYARQCRNTQARLKGKLFNGMRIVEVGAPSDARLNGPTLVPVQFADGTYGVIWDEKRGVLLHPDNPKAARAIKRSRSMPIARPGIGSGVVWVTAYPPKKNIAYAGIKVYYNDKEGRGDSYREVSWKRSDQLKAERKAEDKSLAKESASNSTAAPL